MKDYLQKKKFKMKYIFVEGLDDEEFIDEIIKNIENVRVIQYSSTKKEKVNSMIQTINRMKEKYILLADLDEKDEKTRKSELKRKYPDIYCENIYFSIQEIEAWYLAGISKNNIKKYKVNRRYLLDTQNITKEKFEKIFKNSRDTLHIAKVNILSEYDINIAKERNNSLNVFLETIYGCFSK